MKSFVPLVFALSFLNAHASTVIVEYEGEGNLFCDATIWRGYTGIRHPEDFINNGNGDCGVEMVRYASCCDGVALLDPNDEYLSPLPSTYENYEISTNLAIERCWNTGALHVKVMFRRQSDTSYYELRLYVTPDSVSSPSTITTLTAKLYYGAGGALWSDDTFLSSTTTTFDSPLTVDESYPFTLSVMDYTFTATWNEIEIFSYTVTDSQYQLTSGTIAFSGYDNCNHYQSDLQLTLCLVLSIF